MSNIKAFNRARTMVRPKRTGVPITPGMLKGKQPVKPKVVKATGRRGAIKVR